MPHTCKNGQHCPECGAKGNWDGFTNGGPFYSMAEGDFEGFSDECRWTDRMNVCDHCDAMWWVIEIQNENNEWVASGINRTYDGQKWCENRDNPDACTRPDDAEPTDFSHCNCHH